MKKTAEISSGLYPCCYKQTCHMGPVAQWKRLASTWKVLNSLPSPHYR